MTRGARHAGRAALRWPAAAALLLACAAADAERRGDVEPLDPLGTWQCLLYGHPGLGDERVLLRFRADGSAALARTSDDPQRPWFPLSPWRADRHAFTFGDFRTGREFEGDLRRETLGGTWRTVSLVGGWWCNAVPGVDEPAEGESYRPNLSMPPLIPERMATPRYPSEAIRGAKQGRVVTCFFVDPDGAIVDPQIVELSDEVFRAPTLEALERSRYRSLSHASTARPGCRSFIYRLDSSL